jgi:hypothetical protein
MAFRLPLATSVEAGRALRTPTLESLRLLRHDRRRITLLAACTVVLASLVVCVAPGQSPHASAATAGPSRAVAMAATPDGGGYWVASSTGGV